MTAEQWAAAKSVLLDAAKLPSSERQPYVERHCADPDIRAELLAMLANPVALSDVIAQPVLARGTRLGGYVVEALLGAGGMGQVYRARDTRLARDVAIKVLPDAVAHDREHLRRFEREAQTLAALNHPHIASVHGLEESEGIHFLVMELIDGPSLATRLEKGRLKTAEAVRIAIDIASALQAAHRAGITHRDLKPANVMLGPNGATLVDFGLAKSTGAPVASFVSTLTAPGMVVGTLPYMAPEQVEGKPTDARTDIFAFGCVLYEMLTGHQPFAGETPSSLAAAILEHEPAPIDPRAGDISPLLTRIVARCLEKNPDNRWQSSADVLFELTWVADVASAPAAGGQRRALRWSVVAICSVMSIVSVAATVYFWSASRAPQIPLPVLRSEVGIAPAEGLRGADRRETLLSGGRPSRKVLDVSPDGRWLAFAAYQSGRQGLYLRDMTEGTVRAIFGTDGAESPFFSPDGKQIGFWSAGALKKVDVIGGPVSTICETEPLRGAAWTDDGAVIFARLLGPLWRVPAQGGTPVAITALQGSETSHSLPHLIPGVRVVLYTSTAGIFAEELDSHHRTLLIAADTPFCVADGRYVATGHLLYVRQGTLEGVPFDVQRLLVTGPPTPLMPVLQSTGSSSRDLNTHAMHVAVSRTGTLFYVPGEPLPAASSSLVWRDLAGKRSTLITLSEYVDNVRISPDGRRVALTTAASQDSPRARIQVLDLGDGTVTALTPLDAVAAEPVWTPDGRRLIVTFAERTDQPANLYSIPVDGSAAPERLSTSTLNQDPQCWTHDGRMLIYSEEAPTTRDDLFSLSFQGGRRELRRLLATEEREGAAALSPDGKWLAYAAGRFVPAGSLAPKGLNVYVRSLSGPTGSVRISPEDGSSAVWSPDGRTLYYTRAREDVRPGLKAMIAVDMVDGRPVSGRPQRELFRDSWFVTMPFRPYDLAPDGRRFLFPEDVPWPVTTFSRISVVLNWTEELKARIQPQGPNKQ